MAAGFTTYSDISQRTTVHAEKQMLKHAEPILVLEPWALNKPLPKNRAETVKFRRAIPFPVTDNQLIEGVTPSPQSMDYEDVEVTMGQYGAVNYISDRVADMNEDPVLNDIAMLAGQQAAETKEHIIWGVLKGGTNVAYTGSATARNQVNSVISLSDQRGVIRFLKNQRAKEHTTMLAGSPNFASEPVAPAFICFAHTDCEADIRNLPGFTPVEKYGKPTQTVKGEVGKVEGVRYIISPLLQPFEGAGNSTVPSNIKGNGTAVDVYPFVYCGQEAFGVVPLKGAGSMSPIVRNPGQPSASDPLGQRGSVGWKMYFAALRLNESWMIRVESGVTAL